MAASGRKASAKGSSEKKRIQQELAAEYEKHRQIRQEVILWGLVAVSLLLFISNFGIGGVVGDFISSILFGIMGFVAYLFPILLLICSFFAISNRGNVFAAVKLVAIVLIAVFFCTFLALLMTDERVTTPAMAYSFGVEEKNGGGFIGGTFAYLLTLAFGSVGAYIITIIAIIVSVVLFTGRLAIRGMRNKGQEMVRSAREHQEERRERIRQGREAAIAVANFTVGPEGEEVSASGHDQKSGGLREKKPDPLDLRASAKASEEKPETAAAAGAQKPDPLDLRALAKASGEKSKAAAAAGTQKPDPLDLRASAERTDSMTELSEDMYDDFIEPTITGFVVKSLSSDGSEPVLKESFEAKRTAASAVPASGDGISEVRPGQDDSLQRLLDAAERDSRFPESAESLSTADEEEFLAQAKEEPFMQAGREPLAQAEEEPFMQTGREPLAQAEEEPFMQTGREPLAQAKEEPLAQADRRTTTLGGEESLVQESALTEAAVPKPQPPRPYVYPPVELLTKAEKKGGGNTEIELKETAAKLQQTLKTFGVNVRVTDISCGPAVTRYEIQPEMGVKVSKIVNLADDIKLNLAAADIRIEAPIPGKAAVGIEVPNKENVMVSFRELIESEEFQHAKSRIAFAVGRDIAGKVKVADIAKMPHVLIAGATGSGKSVCINTIIMSILYKAKPDEVKLIMIDPKVVELSVYNGIPHLMIPVVTDPKKAAGALNWAVQEMTDRYNRFAETGVRKFEEYNAKIDKLPEGQDRPEKMCQLVIIVDELADLMMVASHEVEDAICRLAQLARAAGIHLVIATQRPSVNVITGLIKANMPSRIAFAVTSGIDSRTILDMNGAEKLLGKGDMLFDPQGVPKPLRVQGAFVSDDEVSNVVSFLKDNNGGASYSKDIQQKMESLENDGNTTVAIDGAEPDDGKDSYFDEAAQIIVDKEKASIGMLQRYLKVGFNRAARIMDQLEEAGIVGPEEGTKPRRVLMTAAEYQLLTAGGVPEEIE